jgi:hypothetical protein
VSEPLNGADLLAKIRPVMREESTQVCLRPDLIEAVIAADQELLASKAKDASGGERMVHGGESPRTVELAEKVRALEEEVVEHSITFRFRAMSKDRWSALCDEHPPRPNNELDKYAGYDRDGVLDAAVRRCLFDPVFDDAAWAELTKVLSDGEWKELTDTVNSLNRGVVDAPKSVLASQILDRAANTSR